MDVTRLFAARADAVQESVIRRVHEEARAVVDPINLSIGQPDFPVPDAVKRAAIRAIEQDRNGYVSNRGVDPLLSAIKERLRWDLGWDVPTGPAGRTGMMVTSGTSGALVSAALSILDPGDELIIPDPYFVLYPRLAEMCAARAVPCDTYPDFRMTAARLEPLITARTKAVIIDSPSNPCGVVSTESECRDLLDLCRRRHVLLISDEIYDEFTYAEGRTRAPAGDPAARRCPSPCAFPGAEECTLLVRGFGKTYGPTGWRLGFAAGPGPLIDTMIRLQQHIYICAPAPLQFAILAAFETDMSGAVERFRRRRDRVLEKLGSLTDIVTPGGAFYAFVRVPERLGMTASRFKDAAKARRVLIVPGAAFSARDTHFRLSYAVDDARLDEGLDILADLMRG